MNKIRLYALIFFYLITNNLKGTEIPVNSSSNKNVSNWAVTHEKNLDVKSVLENYDNYLKSKEKNEIQVVNLSNFNDVVISMYQLFDSLDYSSSVIARSIIKSNINQKVAINYFSYDLDAQIFINSKQVGPEIIGEDAWIDYDLKKGDNTITIIGRCTGNYASAFKILILDEKYSQVTIKVVDENNKPIENPEIFIRDESRFQNFNRMNGSYYIFQKLEKDFASKFWLAPGKYHFGAFSKEYYNITNEIIIKSRQNYNFTLKADKKSYIVNGTIMTKDKVTPHPGIVLQMENIQNGIVFNNSLTGVDGKYSFNAPPGKYYLRMHANNKLEYHLTEDEKTIIKGLLN